MRAHCVAGNLQAVLNEYVQVLNAASSLGDGMESLPALDPAFTGGSGLRASTQAMDFFSGDAHGGSRRRLPVLAVRSGLDVGGS